MPGLVRSRSKNGVASLACGIHDLILVSEDVDGRVKPGHDALENGTNQLQFGTALRPAFALTAPRTRLSAVFKALSSFGSGGT